MAGGEEVGVELVNHTPLAAKIYAGKILESHVLFGQVVAKATFSIEDTGVVLETQSPLPIISNEPQTPLGLLPRDDLPRNDDRFEVFLLGKAYAPEGRPVPSMNVSLSVGGETRELRVSGDRNWHRVGDTWTIGEPEPFEEMDLVYERTFGGGVEVEVDRDSFIDVCDPINRHGKGFDVTGYIEPLARHLGCPAGYPRYEYARALPNIESPNALITVSSDTPAPAGWGPVPYGVTILPDDSAKISAEEQVKSVVGNALYRAHPSWIIAPPARGALVKMVGLRPTPGAWAFRLPQLEVVADYTLGHRGGSLPLTAQALLLLPEERRFTLLYRAAFQVMEDAGERSFRLRCTSRAGEG